MSTEIFPGSTPLSAHMSKSSFAASKGSVSSLRSGTTQEKKLDAPNHGSTLLAHAPSRRSSQSLRRKTVDPHILTQVYSMPRALIRQPADVPEGIVKKHPRFSDVTDFSLEDIDTLLYKPRTFDPSVKRDPLPVRIPSFKGMSALNFSVDCASMFFRDLSDVLPIYQRIIVSGAEGKVFAVPVFAQPSFFVDRLAARHKHVPFCYLKRLYREVQRTEDSIWMRLREGTLVPFTTSTGCQIVRQISVNEMELIKSGDVEQNPGPPQGQNQKSFKVKASRSQRNAAAIGRSLMRSLSEEAGRRDAQREIEHGSWEEEDQGGVHDPAPQAEEPPPPPPPPEIYDHDLHVGAFFQAEIGWDIRTKTISSTAPPFQALVTQVHEDGSVEFSVQNFPWSVGHIALFPEEIEVASQMKVHLDPLPAIQNLTAAVKRCKCPIRKNARAQMTVPYLLYTLASPRPGYDFLPDSDVTVTYSHPPEVEDFDGEIITRHRLEVDGWRFNDDALLRAHEKQIRMTHAAPYVFKSHFTLPDWGDMTDITNSVAKRLCTLRLPPRPPNIYSDLRQISSQLVDYMLTRGEVASLSECWDKWCKGRPAGDVACATAWKEAWSDGDGFNEDCQAYLDAPVLFFNKAEQYFDENPKHIRYIAQMDLKWRALQAYVLSRTLHFIETALKACDVKGLTQAQIKERIDEKFEEVPEAFETDVSSMETNCTAPVRENIEIYIFERIAQHIGDNITPVLDRMRRPRVFAKSADGTWWNHSFESIRFSGDLWTSVGNLLTNIVVSYATVNASRAKKEMDPIPLQQFLEDSLFEGDDGLLRPYDLSPEEFAETASSLGFTWKADCGPATALSFCGNKLSEKIDGTMVRSKSVNQVAAKLSVIFTSKHCDRRNAPVMRQLQRAKALSMLAETDSWIPDVTVLPLLIEALTRSDKVTEKVVMDAYGRLSEWNAYHPEGCLRDHPVGAIRELVCCTPLSPRWYDLLISANSQAGGVWCLSDIQLMVENLCSTQRMHITSLPEDEELMGSTFQVEELNDWDFNAAYSTEVHYKDAVSQARADLYKKVEPFSPASRAYAIKEFEALKDEIPEPSWSTYIPYLLLCLHCVGFVYLKWLTLLGDISLLYSWRKYVSWKHPTVLWSKGELKRSLLLCGACLGCMCLATAPVDSLTAPYGEYAPLIEAFLRVSLFGLSCLIITFAIDDVLDFNLHSRPAKACGKAMKFSSSVERDMKPLDYRSL